MQSTYRYEHWNNATNFQDRVKTEWKWMRSYRKNFASAQRATERACMCECTYSFNQAHAMPVECVMLAVIATVYLVDRNNSSNIINKYIYKSNAQSKKHHTHTRRNVMPLWNNDVGDDSPHLLIMWNKNILYTIFFLSPFIKYIIITVIIMMIIDNCVICAHFWVSQ